MRAIQPKPSQPYDCFLWLGQEREGEHEVRTSDMINNPYGMMLHELYLLLQRASPYETIYSTKISDFLCYFV